MLTTLLFLAITQAASAECGCTAAFDEIASATEANYAGYLLKLPDDESREKYRRFKMLLRDETTTANAARCAELVDTYTGFFADHHLFAFPQEGPAPALSKSRRNRSESEVEKYFADAGTRHSPLEGFWYDKDGRLAIVPNAALEPGTLAAIRLDGEYAGKIIALFLPQGDGYRAHYLTESYGWQHADANLRRNGDLLIFGLNGFGRKDAEHLNTGNPLAPYFTVLEDGIYYLSLPSFMPDHTRPLQEIIQQHGPTLAKAKGLIIDVRGNAGGNAIYFNLAEYFLSNDIRISDGSRLLASPWTVDYFARFREQLGEHGAWLDEPLQRMREHPGEIIDYREGYTDGLETYPAEPERVVVLQDGGVGSAAEAFIYHARQSNKVTTMGKPTRGNIDYMQVSMKKLGCGENAYWFGYPLYFKAELPAQSVDDEGYPPDVRLRDGQDWLEFAKKWIAAD